MLFEDALFYPKIDIEDEGWLKSAILLWDNISTIVPQSMDMPYKNECSRIMAEAKILHPYRVNPYSESIIGLGNVVRRYLNSPQGRKSFKRRGIQNNNLRVADRNSNQWIQRHPEYKDFKISAEKFGADVQDVIREHVNEDGYVITDSHFMMFYMTALANKLCQKSPTKALLTDMVYMQELTNNMINSSHNHRIGKEIMQQGFMYKYIIDGIKVDPKTSIDKLLKFRLQYKNERDEFKSKISEMIAVQNLQDLPPEEMMIQIGRLYRTSVEPSLRNLEKALRGGRVNCWIEGGASLAITCLTIGHPNGLPSTISLLSKQGLKILGKIFDYGNKKENIINSNPLSYLLRTKQFRRKA